MAQNYKNGHSWDHLDSKACLDAAEELDQLQLALDQQNIPVKYYQPNGIGPIHAVYGSSSINFVECLISRIDELTHALKTIRESGWNEHPTSIWMQKVAANAMEPNKWPKQPDQPQ